MKLYAGIDGGQSSTVAVIGDERGQILGRGDAGPCDYIDEPQHSTRLDEALNGALQSAAKSANLEKGSHYSAIVAGISGFDESMPDTNVRLPGSRLRLLHDARIAWQGAFGGEPGIVVIAGTGSVAYGCEAGGRSATIGGWGYLFGDRGSAFFIARRALSVAMQESDAGRNSALATAALDFFAQSSLRAIAHAFYVRDIGRPQLAKFATAVADTASRGDAAAENVIGEAMHALALLARHAWEALECLPGSKVAFTGGLMEAGQLSEAARQRLSWVLPQAHSVQPRFEPAVGALLLAYQEDLGRVPRLTLSG